MMRYISTRGSAPALDFTGAALAGLALDGGLYVPESIPQFSTADITALKGLSYPTLAHTILTPFIGDSLASGVLAALLEDTYAQFDHPDVAPLKQIGQNDYLLELFHGPTLAFKDFALQFLGRLMGHILSQQNKHALVLGATSGDTGSAAIAGFAGLKQAEICILHPHNRTSEVQRRQMTTVTAKNVHNIAIEGTFDDCQRIVKTLFSDSSLRQAHTLISVNSINWARILAQVVYYFYAALQLGAPIQKVRFSVPTGNFGDIYAGYVARQMGLPIDKLIIATNRNDILARCVKTGRYEMAGVAPSLSPSMDIEISSNFERLLFDLFDRNGAALAAAMQKLGVEKRLVLTPAQHTTLQQLFAAASADDAATLATIKHVYETNGELIDPHTAVGVAVSHICRGDTHIPMVTLATAHPAKFPEAVKKATGITPALPSSMVDLFTRPERYEVLPADAGQIKAFLQAQAG